MLFRAGCSAVPTSLTRPGTLTEGQLGPIPAVWHSDGDGAGHDAARARTPVCHEGRIQADKNTTEVVRAVRPIGQTVRQIPRCMRRGLSCDVCRPSQGLRKEPRRHSAALYSDQFVVR